MLELQELVTILQRYPSLTVHLTLEALSKFIHLIRLLKPYLLTIKSPAFQVSAEESPEHLPRNVHDFLKLSMDLDDEVTKLAWLAVSPVAWIVETDIETLRHSGQQYIQLFIDHGLARGIAFYHFAPPTVLCYECSKWRSIGGSSERELKESMTFPITVFTQDFGPVPGLQTSMSSAMNCARIYNESLAGHQFSPTLPITYFKSLELDTEDVWNGLFLYWLLVDCQENGLRLELDHGASSQAQRLERPLHARNLRMSGPGQEEWNHACDDCCWIDNTDQQNLRVLRSVVVDGTDLQRITCEVHDCTNTLGSLRDFFCPEHQYLSVYCVVDSCKALAGDGFKTCADKDHRKMEEDKNLQNKAMFRLKRRLMRLQNLRPELNIADVLGDDDDDDELCNGKPESGNRPRRARFSHRLTHNEELCVASCGIILGRATFYGSEAPNGVRVCTLLLEDPPCLSRLLDIPHALVSHSNVSSSRNLA
ncbi:hypothetical protein H0H93_009450 [Arthromyces matolae]|nr:hypothetical protein H0H93_009450 [Arthromyces matolae]